MSLLWTCSYCYKDVDIDTDSINCVLYRIAYVESINYACIHVNVSIHIITYINIHVYIYMHAYIYQYINYVADT
jgi:hypothetical protein